VPRLFPRGGSGGTGRALPMKALRSCGAAIALAALVATAPAAQTAGISILGTWAITEMAPAPWSPPAQRAALAATGKRQLNFLVTFAQASISSKFKRLDCKSRVIYEPNALEVDSLFQGNLPEPNPAAAAARLGFPKGNIPGVDVRCIKEQFTFHFRDPNTALINLDGVIYTLKRQ
jgi:hypothetical protein